MANQSLVSVPPNVQEPVVLQRFLSRLVEQLDVVLGNRAGPNDQYVSQQDLLKSAEELSELLQVAQDSLEQALLRLDDVDELIVEELTKRIIAVEEKNVEQDNRLDTIESITPIKGAMLKFTVDVLGEPNILINFNIKTNAVHIGLGIYEFELNQQTVNGVDIITNVVTSVSHFIQPTAVSELFSVEFVEAPPSKFRLQVTIVEQGVGNKLIVTPYDIQVNDKIHVMGLVNIPGTVLPSP